MGIDEILDKGRKAVDEGARKVHDARHSEKAEHVRHGIVDGFEKAMKAILPGEPKKPRRAIGSAQQHVDEAVKAARDAADDAQ